jgi:hypothetical protein
MSDKMYLSSTHSPSPHHEPFPIQPNKYSHSTLSTFNGTNTSFDGNNCGSVHILGGRYFQVNEGRNHSQTLLINVSLQRASVCRIFRAHAADIEAEFLRGFGQGEACTSQESAWKGSLETPTTNTTRLGRE